MNFHLPSFKLNGLARTTNPVRAAFQLTRLALLVSVLLLPVRSAEPFHLDRLGVIRLVPDGPAKLRRERGILFHDGRTTWTGSESIPIPPNPPLALLNRTLVSQSAWRAYEHLGFGSLTLFDGDGPVSFGDESFIAVWPSTSGFPASGRLVNLSVRTRLAPGGDGFVSGFVITEQVRAVLIRAVGPGLSDFVSTPLAPDPALTLYRGNVPLVSNDNWSEQPDATRIASVTAHVGAFPLAAGSRDAAVFVSLIPGAYTVRVSPASPDLAGGEVLLEIHTVSDDIPLARPVVN